MALIDRFRCSICGRLDCSHVRDETESNKRLREALRRRKFKLPSATPFVPITVNPFLMTESSYQDFFKRQGINQYDFKESPGRVDIFIRHYWISLRKLILETEKLKPMGTVVIYKKYTFKQWLQTIKLYRSVRYHYLKLQRKLKPKRESLTKFDMMT